MSASASPDCRDGKHGACDGGSWDLDADMPADCACTCHRSDRGSAGIEDIILILALLVVAGIVADKGLPVALHYVEVGFDTVVDIARQMWNLIKAAL